MRPARMIVAATLSAVAIAAGSYLALSTSTRHPAAAPDSPVVQTPTSTGGSTNPEPAVLADGRHPVLLKAIDPGRGTVTFDLIQYSKATRPPSRPPRTTRNPRRPTTPTRATSTPSCARCRCEPARPSPPTSWPAATRTSR